MKEWIKAILILPFNVIVIIPCLILYFCGFSYSNPGFFSIIIGIISFFTGMYLLIVTCLLFHKIGKGTLAPWNETKHLVVEGPYKIVRNPMILGVMMILLAEAFLLNSYAILMYLIIFFVINTVYFKMYEEKKLIQKFGDEYIRYRNEVPMWLPMFKDKI